MRIVISLGRLAVALIWIASSAAPAAASPAEDTSRPRVAVVAIMTETRQALLWNGARGEYAVVRAGARLGRFVVTAIERDRVVLEHRRSKRRFVIPRGPISAELPRPAELARVLAGPRAGSRELIDPYASDAAPVDRPVVPAVPAVPPVLDPYAAPPAAAPAAGRVTRVERFRVSRRRFEAVITDFETLSSQVDVALTDRGAHIHRVARGSFFHRLGLRSGDLVVSVDGRAVHSVDDAAAIYARLAEVDRFAVLVVRGAETLLLRYRFQR